KIDTVQSTINDVSATVQQNSSAISTINKDGSTAHKTMWSTKAQAGEIKAGIGILAKSDGTSQVAVSASQFIVFNPNQPNGSIQPLFAIDKGKVVIPKALIETATIQILTAQRIVADEVKVGIRLSSPAINGGYITGGWAGFGVGGPYSGYHTLIEKNGTIRTNRLIMDNGGRSRLFISGDRLEVWENGRLRVRLGKL
ncbi:TPA: phage tail tip fiber protein, partial [Photobacterium damselae]